MSIVLYLEAHTCPAKDSTYGYRDHFGSFIQTTLSEDGTKWSFRNYFF